MTVEDLSKWVGGIALALAAVIGGVVKASKGRLDMRVDSSKREWIEQQEERLRSIQNRSDECDRKNESLIIEVAGLKAKLEALETVFRQRDREYRRMRHLLLAVRPELSDLLDSDFGRLDEVSLIP